MSSSGVKFLLETPVTGRTVPSVSVTSHQAQHHFLSATSDRERRMGFLQRLWIIWGVGHLVELTMKSGARLGEHRLKNSEAFLQLFEPRTDRRKLIAISLKLLGHPSCTQADF